MRIDGLTGQAIQYGEIKDALSEFAVPRFVDLNDDEGYAIARFDDNESAVKACACVEIEGAAVTVVVMAPELEDAYRKDADAKREAAREAKRGKGGKGGRGRRQRKGPVHPVGGARPRAWAGPPGPRPVALRASEGHKRCYTSFHDAAAVRRRVDGVKRRRRTTPRTTPPAKNGRRRWPSRGSTFHKRTSRSATGSRRTPATPCPRSRGARTTEPLGHCRSRPREPAYTRPSALLPPRTLVLISHQYLASGTLVHK